jgi:Ca2+-binding EF-hand superfamily protein
MINRKNFFKMWDLMDLDKSGDLDPTELSRMITSLRNKVY